MPNQRSFPSHSIDLNKDGSFYNRMDRTCDPQVDTSRSLGGSPHRSMTCVALALGMSPNPVFRSRCLYRPQCCHEQALLEGSVGTGWRWICTTMKAAYPESRPVRRILPSGSALLAQSLFHRPSVDRKSVQPHGCHVGCDCNRRAVLFWSLQKEASFCRHGAVDEKSPYCSRNSASANLREKLR